MCHICNTVRNAIRRKNQSIKPVPPVPTILSKEQEQAFLTAINVIPNSLDLLDVATLILGTGICQEELRCRLCARSIASARLARIFGAHGFGVEDGNDAMKDLKVTN
jgi:hypothetical protein